MNIVFIVGIIESLFFILILLTKKNKSYADKVFIIWLLIISATLLIPVFVYSDYLKYIQLNGIDYALLVLHPIFLFVYTNYLVNGGRKAKIKYLNHIGIFFINCILVSPYILMDKESKLSFIINSEFNLIIWIGTIWVNIIFLIYLLKTSCIIFEFQKKLKNQYSYTENINLDWLKYLTIGLFIVYFAGSVIGSILCYIGVPLYYINFYVYSTLVLFLFGLGFFGIKQKNIFTNEQTEEKDLAKKQTATTDKDILFAQKLKDYMIAQKPYLNEKLTLNELSVQLEVKSYYITFILNRVLKKNFYDFINYYRVEEIKKRINEGELSKYTMLSIAFDCGFNSKASFNRIFKSYTGYNPTQYLRSISDPSESEIS